MKSFPNSTKEKITSFYEPFLKLLEYSEKVRDKANYVGWSDTLNQFTRFKILTQYLKNGDKVLDWGCGLGDYVNYLTYNHYKVNYCGIDINSKYLNFAKEKFPNEKFLESNIFEIDEKFDYIIASGIFSIKTDEEFFIEQLKRGFKLTNKFLAFNLLKEHQLNQHEAFRKYEPNDIYEKMIKIFGKKTTNIFLFDNYLDDDFSIILKKC